MTKKILILLLVLSSAMIWGQKVVPLPQIAKPETLSLYKNQIFITENVKVHIFSTLDYRHLMQFGKRGEGPGEFKIQDNVEVGIGIQISVRSDYILVNSIGRLSYFSRDGKYLREINTHKGRGPYGNNFTPIGANFVAYDFVNQNNTRYVTIVLYNSKLEPIKELYRHLFFVQPGKKTNPEIWRPSVFYVKKDKIFIDHEDGSINIYDHQGQQVKRIKSQYPLVKETSTRINNYNEFLRTDPRFRHQWDFIKKTLEYPKHLPLIRYYSVDNNHIYVLTNQKEGKKSLIYILDHKGIVKQKAWLKLLDKSPIEPYPYTINKGRLYQIFENDDTEDWELHITKISGNPDKG